MKDPFILSLEFTSIILLYLNYYKILKRNKEDILKNYK